MDIVIIKKTKYWKKYHSYALIDPTLQNKEKVWVGSALIWTRDHRVCWPVSYQSRHQGSVDINELKYEVIVDSGKMLGIYELEKVNSIELPDLAQITFLWHHSFLNLLSGKR